MKRYLSLLIVLVMMVSVMGMVATGTYAAVNSTVVARLDGTDDLNNWWYRRWGRVNVGTGLQANGTPYGSATPNYIFTDAIETETGEKIYPKMGSYFLGISDVRESGPENDDMTSYLTRSNINTPINGAAYVNFWVYSIPGDDGVILRWSFGLDTATAGDTGQKITLTGGWQLISIPILSKYRQGTLMTAGFSTEGYSMPSTGINYKNTTVYIDGIFLSGGEPAASAITGSSIENGSQLVKHNIPKIDLYSADIKSAEDGAVTITPDADFHLEFAKGVMSIVFDEELQYGTNYTLSFLGGVYDSFGMEYEPYELNFRTRAVDENIPPEISLLAPESGTRYVPSDEIIMTANAIDDNGTIQYVEFYCNDVLIEGSRTTSDTDEFKFVWTNAPESVEEYRITAKALDNDGASVSSDYVTILVLGYKNPEISLNEKEIVLYKSVGGIEGNSSFTLTGTTSDIDDKVTQIDIYLDGELIHTETEKVDEFSYTYQESLDNGEYTVSVVATDESGRSAEKDIAVRVTSLGKSFPAVFGDDFTLAKWSVSKKTGTVTPTDNGLEIATTSTDTVRAGRNYMANLSILPWQADIMVVPDDTNHLISVGLGGTTEIEIFSFNPDGTTSAGGSYEANKAYMISAIADTQNGTISYLVNEKLIKTEALTTSIFASKAEVFVKHSGSNAKTTIKSLKIYTLKDATELESVSIYTEGVKENLNEVSSMPGYIDVKLVGGTDASTISGNVKVLEKGSGKEIATNFADGKVYINEVLKKGKIYTMVIGSNISNLNGQGLCGATDIDFTCKSGDVNAFIECNGTNVTVFYDNNSGAELNAVVVIAGKTSSGKTLPLGITPVILEKGSDKSIEEISLIPCETGDILQIFVLDSMNAMKALTSQIFEIKKG